MSETRNDNPTSKFEVFKGMSRTEYGHETLNLTMKDVCREIALRKDLTPHDRLRMIVEAFGEAAKSADANSDSAGDKIFQGYQEAFEIITEDMERDDLPSPN